MSSNHRAAYDRTAHRLRESERVIIDRGGVIPDTADADVYLVPIARLLRRLSEGKTGPKAPTLRERMERWAQRMAPDVDDSVLDDAVAAAMRGRGFIEKDDEIAALWRVSYAERQRLKLVTIGAYDVDKRGRKRRAAERRRERDRLRARAKRAAHGAVSREQSLSRTRPWEAFGIKRRAWERRGKPMPPSHDANPSPHNLLSVGRRICVVARRAGAATPQGPAGRTSTKRAWATRRHTAATERAVRDARAQRPSL